MSHSNSYIYYLRFFISGIAEPLVFKVDEETSERARQNLRGQPSSFFWFSTLDGRDIVIDLGSIDLLNILWERGVIAPSEDDDKEIDDYMIRVHFKARSKPYETRAAEEWEVYDLFWYLEMGSYNDDPFLSFTDEDGERVFVDGRKILFLDAPTELLSEGAKQVEEQDAIVAKDTKRPKQKE